MPDLVAMLTPKHIFLSGLSDAASQPTDTQTIQQVYAKAIQSHAPTKSLQISTTQRGDKQIAELLRWLEENNIPK
ncbi:MAG: hypothetical protein R2822_21735 [Spirosomataceae bacterium]